MKWLFDNLSGKVSKMTTRTYSTSFSLGIYFLNRRLHHPVYAIYGFVRVADEIVDSFEGYNKQDLLEEFMDQTYKALENRISPNPILNSFQAIAHKYNIGFELIGTFFESMEMDIDMSNHTNGSYQKYVLGSAEVIGLMCLRVFVEGDNILYKELKPYAMKLGAAFQKVNFLRDLKNDYHTLNRVYFPNIDMTNFSHQSKKQIEMEIEQDFKRALPGIKKLPSSSRGGVYLAYITYVSLFNKIKSAPPSRILNERIRINNGKKIGLMVNSMVKNKFDLI
jgi:phytoene/squalene synthetase